MAVTLAVALTTGACGTPSPDLFVVDRDGTVPGARLNLLVSDTSARCNRADPEPLSSEQILEARDLRDELLKVQRGEVTVPPAPPAQIFRFAIRTELGTLRYADTAQRPEVLPRLVRFVRRVAIDLCGLER
ncbi:MAG TPA: hypothetical protein VMY78_00805 [Solirubrobacteraceae bacterium]|nr:hypothetical protein [Solirubrobacteraceae bacterium]